MRRAAYFVRAVVWSLLIGVGFVQGFLHPSSTIPLSARRSAKGLQQICWSSLRGESHDDVSGLFQRSEVTGSESPLFSHHADAKIITAKTERLPFTRQLRRKFATYALALSLIMFSFPKPTTALPKSIQTEVHESWALADQDYFYLRANENTEDLLDVDNEAASMRASTDKDIKNQPRGGHIAQKKTKSKPTKNENSKKKKTVRRQSSRKKTAGIVAVISLAGVAGSQIIIEEKDETNKNSTVYLQKKRRKTKEEDILKGLMDGTSTENSYTTAPRNTSSWQAAEANMILRDIEDSRTKREKALAISHARVQAIQEQLRATEEELLVKKKATEEALKKLRGIDEEGGAESLEIKQRQQQRALDIAKSEEKRRQRMDAQLLREVSYAKEALVESKASQLMRKSMAELTALEPKTSEQLPSSATKDQPVINKLEESSSLDVPKQSSNKQIREQELFQRKLLGTKLEFDSRSKSKTKSSSAVMMPQTPLTPVPIKQQNVVGGEQQKKREESTQSYSRGRLAVESKAQLRSESNPIKDVKQKLSDPVEAALTTKQKQMREVTARSLMETRFALEAKASVTDSYDDSELPIVPEAGDGELQWKYLQKARCFVRVRL